jgi:hypothetical protein
VHRRNRLVSSPNRAFRPGDQIFDSPESEKPSGARTLEGFRMKALEQAFLGCRLLFAIEPIDRTGSLRVEAQWLDGAEMRSAWARQRIGYEGS